MILHLYLARRWVRQFLIVGGAFLAILFLIDLVEQIRRFGGAGIGLRGTAGVAALNVAGSFYGILPLIALLAGLSLFLSMSRSSEMAAVRASGRSGLRALSAPVIAATLVGAACVAILNPIVAGTSKRYDAAVARIDRQGQQTVSLGEGAVWLRQGLLAGQVPGTPQAGAAAAQTDAGSEGGQIVIRATRASPDATTLYDPTFIVFTPNAGPTMRFEAQSAQLEPGAWLLRGVKEWPLAADNPEVAARDLPMLRLPTELTAARIRDGFGAPDAIPVWQLPGFIRGLESAGFSAMRHRVWLQMELARPFLMGAMVLIAAAFAMRPTRGRRIAAMVLGGFGAGLALFFLRNLAQVLGETGQVPPVMAAFAPVAVAVMLALALLLKLEEG